MAQTSRNVNGSGADLSLPFQIPNPNITFAIIIPVLCLIVVVGNLMIIISFWKLPSLREKPSDFLILNLSVADLITGLVTIPFFSFLYIVRGYYPLGEGGCRVRATFLNITIHSSLFTLVAISLDRLLLVLKEYPAYLKLQSQARVNATIVLCWAFATFTVIIVQSFWDYAKVIDETAASIDFSKVCLEPTRRLKSYSLTVFLGIYFTPVITVCGCSIWFFYLLRKKLTKNKVSQLASSQSGQSGSAAGQEDSNQALSTSTAAVRNRYIKPAVSLFVLVVAMAVCMLPYCLYVVTIEFFCEECNNLNIMFSLLLLQFCNACLDPVFYGLTQRKIRQFYCSCLTRRRVAPALN